MESLVGREFSSSEPHTVTADGLARFSELFGGGSCWPTFGMTLAAPAWQQIFDDPELGFELARTVHADQTFDIHRPFRAGDVIVAAPVIVKDRRRGSSVILTVEVSLNNGDELVATSTSTLMIEMEQR